MAQLMPLPLTVSCFSEIQIGFTFLVPAYLASPGKRPLNGCVCTPKGKEGRKDRRRGQGRGESEGRGPTSNVRDGNGKGEKLLPDDQGGD